MKLICGDLSDWSHFHFIMPVMPDKAECSVALCTALPQKPLQQRHLMAKNELAFSFRSKRKDQQADGQYANVSCWGQHYTAWDSFWEQLFQCFRVDSLFWENNFIHSALSELKLCRMFSFTSSCVTHCMKGHFQNPQYEALKKSWNVENSYIWDNFFF